MLNNDLPAGKQRFLVWPFDGFKRHAERRVIIMTIEELTDKEFEEKVLKAQKPVIVDVWAPWCGPCVMYSPIIEEVSKEYDGKALFFKTNADENEEIVRKFNIMSIPTTLLIENGNLKALNVGAVPKSYLKKWIDSNI
ncbi:MAG: thioredoxin [Candidatus Micrarchaeaceae archaeon]